MGTREMAKQIRLQQWAEVMRERTQSGKTIRQWCAENGINEKRYYYWQQKLREATCAEYVSAQETAESELSGRMSREWAAECRENRQLAKRDFAEVRIADTSAQVEPPPSGTFGSLCAAVGAVQVRVDSDYPVGQLAALLRELSAC